MTQTADIRGLQTRLRQLEAQNKSLQQHCDRLTENQQRLEELIATATQKQLTVEMQNLELEQIFSSCADPIWVVRQDNVVVRANAAMLCLLGRCHDEVIGKLCYEVFDTCPRQGDACPLHLAHRPRSFHEWDIACPAADRSSNYYMVSTASLVTIDGSPGIVAQFRDITMRKQAEAALEQANRALSHMARVDGLTQIPNRRAFDETLSQEWSRMAREDSPLSLVLCDIDCFKNYNDHYGHNSGDDCLRRVARALADCAQRPADLAARYGGEEFVLLLPDTPRDGARKVAETVRHSVEQLGIEHATSLVKPVVTLSIGVASMVPAPKQAPEVLIEAADKALYRAKDTGRNTVMCLDATRENLPSAQSL